MDYNLDLMGQYHVSLLGTVIIIIIIKRLVVLITTKTNEDYSQVMCNIRTRLSMDIMRSVLVAVRGVCVGRQRRHGPPLYPMFPLT